MMTLLNRAARPMPAHEHDHLFTDIAPGSAHASARMLAVLYEQHTRDDAAPPQYKHFRRLVQALVRDVSPRALRGLSGKALDKMRAAYVCCFEPHEPYARQRASFWADPALLAQLMLARDALIKDLEIHAAEEARRRAQLRTMIECRAAPIDLCGVSLLALIKQMSPDDWHEIVLNWHWDHGVTELEWITAHPECDRATALYAYCLGEPSRVALRANKPSYEHGRWDYGGFVRAVAARLENGFYMNAALKLELGPETAARFAAEMARARASKESPWQLEPALLNHPGRPHQPKYTLHHGAVHYHYDYWMAREARVR